MPLLLSRPDLEFLLYRWLDVAALTARPRYAEHARATFDAVLDVAERIATEHFASHNRASDLDEPRFDGARVTLIPQVGQALRAFIDAGMLTAEHDTTVGGMQLPVVVAKAAFAYFTAANAATTAYPFLSIANANLLLAHGTAGQVDAFARPLLAGRFFGTMCLSEPQAGSSLADIVTRAVADPAGADDPLGPRYRLTGNKMWISAGEHDLAENIVHLVLAKIVDGDGRLPAGVHGISLFAVPRTLVALQGEDEAAEVTLTERNDVALAGLNHKMGYRGTTNCLLNFGEGRQRPGGAAGAIGYRVGAVGGGLAAMFHMMNEARIGVGLGAAMLGYTGYLHALAYARTRPQGRPPGPARDARAPQVPIIDHADVRRMLLAQKSYVEGGLALALYCAKLVDEQRTAPEEDARVEAGRLLDILTPVAKSWPAQWCLAANDLAIQVHGGYGYTRDYPVEQFWRDNRLNAIHEGTHGIQALDLLGRKVVVDRGAALRALGARMLATAQAATLSGEADLARWASSLLVRVQRVADVTAVLLGTGDVRRTLANASTYLEAFGHVVVAWIWLEQAVAATRALAEDGGPRDLLHGKRHACRYFFLHELPRVDAQFDLLVSLDTTVLDGADAWY